MSRSPTLFYDPEQLTEQEASRLSIGHYSEHAESGKERDNRPYQHLGKHRMVVGPITVSKQANGASYRGNATHTLDCISASAPMISNALPVDRDKYLKDKSAYLREQTALLKRIIAHTKTTELVMPLLGLDDNSLDGLSADQKKEYRESVIESWLDVVWRQHATGSSSVPKQLIFVMPNNPLAGDKKTLDILNERLQFYRGRKNVGGDLFPDVKVKQGDLIDYCVADTAHRTLVNASSPRVIGGEYRTKNGTEERLVKRSDLLQSHVNNHDIKVDAFEANLRSSTVLRADYSKQTNFAVAMHTVTDDAGELYIVLTRDTTNKHNRWQLPEKEVTNGQAEEAAVNALQEKTGITLTATDFVFSGNPGVVPPLTTVVPAQQFHYLRHHVAEIQKSDALQGISAGLTPATDHEVKLVKVSEWKDASDVLPNDALKLQEVYDAHERSKRFLKERRIKEAWEKEKNTPISMSDFGIIATSGSNANCLGAALGESLLLRAVYGHAGEKHYFETNKERFKPLFEALKTQTVSIDDLYSSATVNSVVDDSRVEDFEAMNALPTSERQARFGAAMRSVFADLLQDEFKNATVAENRIYGNELLDVLLADFTEYLDKPNFKCRDVFENMDFVTQKFAQLKAKLNNDSQSKPSIDALKQELKNWWHSNGGGYEDYIAKIRTPGTYLGPIAAGALAGQFGVKLRYKYQSEDKDRGANDLSEHGSVNRPIVHIHYNGTDHWSAFVPKKLQAIANQQRDEDRQLVASEDLSKQEITAYKERRMNEISVMRTEISDFEQFATNASRFYSAEHEREAFPYEVQEQERRYFRGFEIGTKTLEIEGGIKLIFSSGSRRMYSESETVSEEEAESSSAELIIRAVESEGERTLSDAGLKQKKLEGIARAYATAFMANGMPKDKLQVDITKIGKLWASDRGAVIEAFKLAGFKRIQINGKDEYNAVREEYKREEEEQERAEEDSSMSAGPLVSRSRPSDAVKRVKGLVSEYPVESTILTATTVGAIVSAFTSDNPFEVATKILLAGLSGLALCEIYQHSLIPKSKEKFDQFLKYLRTNLKEAIILAGKYALFAGLAYYSGLDSNTWSGLGAFLFLQSLLANVTQKALELPYLNQFSDTKKWLITMAASRAYTLYKTLSTRNINGFFLQVVGFDNTMKLPDYMKKAVWPFVQSKMPQVHIPGSQLIQAALASGSSYTRSGWDRIPWSLKYAIAIGTYAVAVYYTGGFSYWSIGYLASYSLKQSLTPGAFLKAAGVQFGSSALQSAWDYFAPALSLSWSAGASTTTTSIEEAKPEATLDEVDIEEVKEAPIDIQETVVDSHNISSSSSVTLFGSYKENVTRPEAEEGLMQCVSQESGGAWMMCCSIANGAGKFCLETVKTTVSHPAVFVMASTCLLNHVMSAVSGDPGLALNMEVANSNSTMVSTFG